MRKWSRKTSDRMFDRHGKVRLPLLAPLAITLAERHPEQCLTRQPSEERAEAMKEALEPLARFRGHSLEIRSGTDSWGLYLIVGGAR